MKGLDRAVVGKQVKQGQQKKRAPRPVEVPGKKREHRQVDEESSQVDLRKRQPFNFIDRNFSADFKLSGLRDAEFIVVFRRTSPSIHLQDYVGSIHQ